MPRRTATYERMRALLAQRGDWLRTSGGANGEGGSGRRQALM